MKRKFSIVNRAAMIVAIIIVVAGIMLAGCGKSEKKPEFLTEHEWLHYDSACDETISFGDDGHFAVYVGNYFPGYENAVIESVYGGVIIRELSESEAINDPFTHYGYMKGIDYTN